MRLFSHLAILFVVSVGLVFSASARAEKHPAEEQGLKSIDSKLPTPFRISNHSGRVVKCYWLNYQGEREHYGTLKDGETLDQMTFIGHPWLVTDEAEKPIGLYFPDGQLRVVRINPPDDDAPTAESAPHEALSPELDVLSPYAGKFAAKSQVTYSGQTLNSTGVSEGRWIHDGHYLRQTWAIKGGDGVPPMNGSAIMTYDPREKTYRKWSFISTGGFVEESRGQWDPATRTMTWPADKNELGGKTITKSAFDEAGKETWSIEFQDPAGQTATEVTGTSTPIR